MKTHAFLGLTVSALLLGGSMVGCAGSGGTVVSAGSRSDAEAAKNADKAGKALANGQPQRAVGFAEAAVAMRPQSAEYRVLLGRAYLKSGRFASANQAFADVLALAPDNGAAALNLALAQIADGKWDIARQTLDAHAATIPAADRGLAIALAGDPAAGVDVLMAATRSPDAGAKTRQNLALALALAGRWIEARTVVAVDVPAGEVDQRLVQWAAFAKPVSASDQVATLLGVVPVKDPGQPIALALNAPAPVGGSGEPVQVAADDPVEPVADAAPAIETAAIPASAVAPDAPADTAPSATAPSEPVTVPVPREASVPMIAAKGAFKTKAAVAAAPAARPLAKGNWFVQLGAFDNAGVARDAWARAKRRYAPFGTHTPAGMPIKAAGGQFYRLSVGGFTRNDANGLCRAYKAKGGTCFIRIAAGDQVALWIKPLRVQVAAR